MAVTDQERDVIERMYLEFPNIQSISDELGHSPVTIRRVLKDRGIIVSGSPGRPAQADLMEDAELEAIANAVREEKEPMQAIAARHHMSMNTLYKVLKSLGMTPRTQTKDHLEGAQLQKDVAIQMYKEGWAGWFIHERTGISGAALNKEIHKRGVQLRGRGGFGKVPLKDAEGKYVKGEGGEYVAVPSGTTRDPERAKEVLRRLHEEADRRRDRSGGGLAAAARPSGDDGEGGEDAE